MAQITIADDLAEALIDVASSYGLSLERYLARAMRTVAFIHEEWSLTQQPVEDAATAEEEDHPQQAYEEETPEASCYGTIGQDEELEPFSPQRGLAPVRPLRHGCPSHYVVIRSPFAQQILSGDKDVEYRPEASAKAMQNKTLAIAVSQSPRTPESGRIIGQVTFGKMCGRGGTKKLPVLSYELWPEEDWVSSPGGQGLRPMPR